MARTVITPVALEDVNVFSSDITTLLAAVDATDGAEFSMNKRDDKTLILVQNAHGSAAKSVTIKAGNGIQGVNDLTKEIASGKYAIIAVDSGRFKNVSGTDKGKVVLTGTSADIKVAVFTLP